MFKVIEFILGQPGRM